MTRRRIVSTKKKPNRKSKLKTKTKPRFIETRKSQDLLVNKKKVAGESSKQQPKTRGRASQKDVSEQQTSTRSGKFYMSEKDVKMDTSKPTVKTKNKSKQRKRSKSSKKSKGTTKQEVELSQQSTSEECEEKEEPRGQESDRTSEKDVERDALKYTDTTKKKSKQKKGRKSKKKNEDSTKQVVDTLVEVTQLITSKECEDKHASKEQPDNQDSKLIDEKDVEMDTIEYTDTTKKKSKQKRGRKSKKKNEDLTKQGDDALVEVTPEECEHEHSRKEQLYDQDREQISDSDVVIIDVKKFIRERNMMSKQLKTKTQEDTKLEEITHEEVVQSSTAEQEKELKQGVQEEKNEEQGSLTEDVIVADMQIEPEYEADQSGYEAFVHDNYAVIILYNSVTLYFLGSADIKVIRGSIDVLGYSLTPSTDWLPAFSPKTDALLSFMSYEGGSLSEDDIPSWLPSELLSRNIDDIVNVTVCLLRETTHKPTTYISCLHELFEVPSYTGLFPHILTVVPCCFYVEDDYPRGCSIINEPETWYDNIVTELLEYQDVVRVLVCGDKGVGKSTFLRYLMNCMLRDGVVLLDGDPGQSECSVPGGVTLTLVKEPLLGPHKCHYRKHIRKIHFGEVSMNNRRKEYIEAIKDLYEYYMNSEELKTLPLFINTMGWTIGLGLIFLCELTRLCELTHVLQINGFSKKTRNLAELNSSYVAEVLSNENQSEIQVKELKHKVMMIDTAITESRGSNAPLNRELSVLAYLSSMTVLDTRQLIPINNVTPYRMDLSKLNFYCGLEKDLSMEFTLKCLLCNLVGLVRIDELDDDRGPTIIKRIPFQPCLGFGVVRGLDLSKNSIYIITPESLETVNEVNCLVIGNVNIPNIVLLAQETDSNSVPYALMSGSSRTSLEKPFRGRTFKPKKYLQQPHSKH